MTFRSLSELGTHRVENQPEPRGDRDLWAEDAALRGACEAAGADTTALSRFGTRLGGQEMQEAGRQANRCPPELKLFDRDGRRLDEVSFHPAYHRLMEEGIAAGYSAVAWEGAADAAPAADKAPDADDAAAGIRASGGHATHAAMVYLQTQIEPGVCCPMTMTYAAVPALRAEPAVAAEWVPRLTSRRYDGRSLPATDKTGATMGMAMTEKQGGSDVRANTTRAEPDGEGWRLTGHKWFCSAPMSDAFLTLAQTDQGLTCFLVPRWTPDGQRNAIRLMRLKEKLGNRANASAEIEYDRAFAWSVGPLGRGVRTIIEMVQHTRLDTAMAPAGLMRAALAEAKWWVEGRSAFQRRLIDQPLMRSVLADLALDWEGATALGLRTAQAMDAAGTGDAQEGALARIAVALAKFLSNKRCPVVVYEAMEVLGGMGYVDDTPLPMLFRESPLNSIWEGAGNVICLDVLRALTREPETGEALAAELDAARGVDRRYDAALAAHRDRWPSLPEEGEARWFTESLASLLTGAVLIRRAPDAVADGWCAARLVPGGRGLVSGTATGLDDTTLIGRI